MDFDLLEHLLGRIWPGRSPLGALGLARSRLLSLEHLELLTQRRTPRRIDHWIRNLRAAERCGELPDWHEMYWYDGFEAFSSVRRENKLKRRKGWADIITVLRHGRFHLSKGIRKLDHNLSSQPGILLPWARDRFLGLQLLHDDRGEWRISLWKTSGPKSSRFYTSFCPNTWLNTSVSLNGLCHIYEANQCSSAQLRREIKCSTLSSSSSEKHLDMLYARPLSFILLLIVWPGDLCQWGSFTPLMIVYPRTQPAGSPRHCFLLVFTHIPSPLSYCHLLVSRRQTN